MIYRSLPNSVKVGRKMLEVLDHPEISTFNRPATGASIAYI